MNDEKSKVKGERLKMEDEILGNEIEESEVRK